MSLGSVSKVRIVLDCFRFVRRRRLFAAHAGRLLERIE